MFIEPGKNINKSCVAATCLCRPNERNKLIEQITYHPYGVSYLGGEFHNYKHPAPLALTNWTIMETIPQYKDRIEKV